MEHHHVAGLGLERELPEALWIGLDVGERAAIPEVPVVADLVRPLLGDTRAVHRSAVGARDDAQGSGVEGDGLDNGVVREAVHRRVEERLVRLPPPRCEGDDAALLAARLVEVDNGEVGEETVGFEYGQRHRVELDCRPVIRERLRSEFPALGRRIGDDHTLDVTTLGTLSETALTREAEIELGADDLDEIEYSGTQFDLGEAVAQSLALAIDPFAVGPGAEEARQRAGIVGEEASGPFAALAALKKK